MTATIIGPGGSVSIRDGVDATRKATVDATGRLRTFVEGLQVDADTINLDTADLEAILTDILTAVQGTLAIAGTVDQGTAGSAEWPVKDDYDDGEVLADQSGDGTVKLFTFAAPVQLVWVRSDGGDSRADPFGGVPDATTGIVCEDGVPNPMTVTTAEVQVYAPVGAGVRVWGFRRG